MQQGQLIFTGNRQQIHEHLEFKQYEIQSDDEKKLQQYIDALQNDMKSVIKISPTAYHVVVHIKKEHLLYAKRTELFPTNPNVISIVQRFSFLENLMITKLEQND